MRRTLLAAVFAVFVSVLVVPTNSAYAGADSDGFRGTWTSIDPFDDSIQYLSIQGSGKSGKHSVFLYDTVASGACGGEPDGVTGAGTVSDDTLYWFFTVTCPGSGKGPVVGPVGPGFFIYDDGTDTLLDDAEAVWTRLS